MIIWLNALQQMTLDNQLMIFPLSCAALLALSGVAISQPTEFRSFVIWRKILAKVFASLNILIPPSTVPLAPPQSALQHLGMQDAARQVTQRPRLHSQPYPSFLHFQRPHKR